MVSMATYFVILKNGSVTTKYTPHISQQQLILQLLTWDQISRKTKHIYMMVRYAYYLIYIFINFNENIRNEWKIVKKSRGCAYKTTHISVGNCPTVPNLISK